LLGAVTASLAELSGASLDRINHHVEYHYLDDEHQGGGKEEAAYLAPRGQEVIMTRHDGTRFNCTLPRVEPSASSGQTPNVPRPSVVSLLAPLKHNCLYRVTHAIHDTRHTTRTTLADVIVLLHQLEGWWTYEYCRGRWVQQFHQEGDERVAAFTLGLAPLEDPDVRHRPLFPLLSLFWDRERRWYSSHSRARCVRVQEESARRRVETEEGSREVYSELHADGTICDITGKPRCVPHTHDTHDTRHNTHDTHDTRRVGNLLDNAGT
jgi:hypothetical protein